MEGFLGLITFLILIILGYTSGRMIETRHYRSIQTREKEFLNLPAVTMKRALDDTRPVISAQLVAGSVVISVDYFKRFLAGLRNLFGGRMSSYETLIDRARREAILRMKEEAKGAHIIVNMRIETASISKGAKQSVGSIEALVYGTAVTYAPGSSQQPFSRQTDAQSSPQNPERQATSFSEPRFKVVFSGEITPGQDLNTVKANIADLYKVSVERCEYMFTGKLITVKDNLDYQSAQKYKTAFERRGAICRLEEM